MKWPFVSRKRFDELKAEHVRLRQDMDDAIDKAIEMEMEGEREVRSLQDELHHARHAIFNTKQMHRYEQMLLDRSALQPPKVFYPAFSTASAVMELTEQQKAELRNALGINDPTFGLKPEDKP